MSLCIIFILCIYAIPWAVWFSILKSSRTEGLWLTKWWRRVPPQHNLDTIKHSSLVYSYSIGVQSIIESTCWGLFFDISECNRIQFCKYFMQSLSCLLQFATTITLIARFLGYKHLQTFPKLPFSSYLFESQRYELPCASFPVSQIGITSQKFNLIRLD